MMIDDLLAEINKEKKKTNPVEPSISGSTYNIDNLLKQVKSNSETFKASTPPGYVKTEEPQIDPIFNKPTYLSQGTTDTRKEDTIFTKLGRFALPQSLELKFGIDESQRKATPTTKAQDLEMIGNAQTIGMANRNPEMVGDLQYFKHGISFGNNLSSGLPGYENDIAPIDLPEPTTMSQKIAYGAGSIITMSLAQPLIESAAVSLISKIPGGASMLAKISTAAKLSPWKIGYPMAIAKAGVEGGLFGLITENKQTLAKNVVETAGTFAGFTALAFPIFQFFKPILSQVGKMEINNPKLKNLLGEIETQGPTVSNTVWFKNPNDKTQILKVTREGIMPGTTAEMTQAGVKINDVATLSKVEIEAFKENPSLYGQLKEWLGGKKINVPFEPPVSVPNVDVPPVKPGVPSTVVEIPKTSVPVKPTPTIPVPNIPVAPTTKIEVPKTTSSEKDLTTEAKKYDSAEEFVKAKENRQTTSYTVYANRTGDGKSPRLEVFSQSEADTIVEDMKGMGFSPLVTENNYAQPTKSQLTDIWNKANKEGAVWGDPNGDPTKTGYKTLTGNSGNSDYFVLNKDVLELQPQSIDSINASKPEGNEPFAITPTVKDRTPFAITPTGPTEVSNEPFISKEDISAEETKRNLELISEDINQKIQDKADEYLSNIDNPTKFDIENATSKAKAEIKKYIEIMGEKIIKPEILVSKTQVKEIMSGLEKDVIEMKVILKDNKKYLHLQQQKPGGNKTNLLIRPSALGLAEGNIKIGDTLKIDIKNLKPKGTSMRAVDSTGNIMASKGSTNIGKFEQQTVAPETSVADSFKLFQKVNDMIKKYAERVGEQYLPRGAAGVYYHGSTRNIRLTSMNELSTAAHEITHYLDEQFEITPKFMEITGYNKLGLPIYDKATAKYRKELTDIYVRYYAGGKNTHKLKTRMSEGFATLVQKYVEMPTTIKQNYPNLVKEILEPGGEYYNDTIGSMLKDLKDIVVEYQGLDDLDKVGAVVTSDKNLTEKDSFLNVWEKIRTEMVDNIYPIESLAKDAGIAMTSKDPSLALRMYSASDTFIMNNINGDRGFWRFKNGDLVKVNDSNWKTLLKRLNKEKTLDSFGNFLVARDQHFEFLKLEKLKEKAERSKKEAKMVMGEIDSESLPEDVSNARAMAKIAEQAQKDYEDLKTILDKNGIQQTTATAAYEKNIDRFKEETTLFDALKHEDVEFMHDKDIGLINDEKYKEFTENKGYAPLKREFYDDILGDAENTSGVSAGGKVSTLKKRTGSSRTILNPIETSMKGHAEIVKKGLKQYVYNQIAKNIAKEFPELFQIQQLQAVPDKNTGAFVFPQEKDPNIIMAIVNGKRVPILTDKYIIGILNEVMTYQNIHILEKIMKASSRIFTKGTTAIYPQFVLSNLAMDTITASAQTSTKMVPIWDALKEISKSLLDKNSPESKYLQEYLIGGGDRQTLVGYQNMSASELLEVVTHERAGLFKILDGWNKGMEILAIPSQYSEIMTRATEYVRARKMGDPYIVAMEKAGRITAPFHHIGRLGGKNFGKSYVRSIPFFNPGLQVVDQTIRTFETPEGRKRAAFVMLVLAALAVSGTVAINSLGTEKQKRIMKDMNPRELSMYVYWPNFDGETLGKLRIPDNYSWLGALINMGVKDRTMDTNYTIGEYVQTGTSFMPNQLKPWEFSQWLFSIMPQIIKTPALIATGKKDFPQIMDIESQGMKNKEPGLRYTEQTSKVAKWLGEEYNLSPVKTDAILTGVFGRASGYISLKPSAYSVSSTVTKDEYFDSGRSMQKFYNIKSENDLKVKSVKDNLRVFTPEEKKTVLKLNDKLKVIDSRIKDYRDYDEVEQIAKLDKKLKSGEITKDEFKVKEQEVKNKVEKIKESIYKLIQQNL